MKAGEKLVAPDKKEVLLFPLEYMNISQDEYGSSSHQNILAMDFLGWGANGRILQCPYYAPCSCKCVGTTGENNRIWQSLNEVHLADGTIDYVTWVQAHDDNPLPTLTVLTQGDLLGHTGTTGNVTGDHVHFNFAKGVYDGWDSTQGNRQLKNSIHIYNACYVNDTIIVNGENHNWITWNQPTPPTPPTSSLKKRQFPWVLYANKLRNESQNN